MEKREFIECKYTSFWKEEHEGIIFFNYSPQLEMTLPIAKELVNDRLDYFKGNSYNVLIDVTNLKSITKEAREYMSSPDWGLKGISGGAFLSKNIVTNVILNLFISINKPTVPAKFFTKKDEALRWLIEIKHKQENRISNEN
ncbi:DUF7793 family protein [Flavobacterium psychrotolerans]|uniref:DUF7793 domain-containing protein n=1 Tax=Flavobacterium psychrotolerans TaxID=2169410 RepID=A0A2U1JHA1_9FLAO|nr:hypothetical protein [Flavobacterium psychrotolerans]PWA04384.1 hypothetical protein DB895_11570 [Flavobacterium psychrotolerans]